MQRDIQISLLALHRMENGMAKRKKKRVNNAHLSPRFMNLFALFGVLAKMNRVRVGRGDAILAGSVTPVVESFPACIYLYFHPHRTSLCVSVSTAANATSLSR